MSVTKPEVEVLLSSVDSYRLLLLSQTSLLRGNYYNPHESFFMVCHFIVYYYSYRFLEQSFSNCGTCTPRGIEAGVQGHHTSQQPQFRILSKDGICV
jgi:hypothetical protein